jgi:iron(III) transport system substrate-binding protein
MQRSHLSLFSVGRRQLLKGGAGIAAASALAPYGALAAGAQEAPDLAAARKEGPLVLWHCDQDNDRVEFYKAFTQKTGIEAMGQRVLPGVALPKLMAEARSGGGSEIDAYDSSDEGMMDELQRQNLLMRYMHPHLSMYAREFKSTPEGFWTAYFINLNPLMYSSKHMAEAMAPKTWADLLDPRWGDGKIGFQNAAAGSQYVWWYNLRGVLPADYWDKLRAQKPRAYSSSTQITADLLNGNLSIGGKVSEYQYFKALREGQDLRVVYPPEGTPTSSQVTGILAGTQRPNAAKAYIDFLLSREGQEIWNKIQGSHSARADVHIADVPDLKNIKILVASDSKDFTSRERRMEFNTLWNKVTGL